MLILIDFRTDNIRIYNLNSSPRNTRLFLQLVSTACRQQMTRIKLFQKLFQNYYTSIQLLSVTELSIT